MADMLMLAEEETKKPEEGLEIETNTVQNETQELESADFNSIVNIVDIVRKASKGQNIENIAEFASNLFEWDTERTMRALDSAVENEKLKEVTYRGKLSYRIIKSNKVVAICDATEQIGTSIGEDLLNNTKDLDALHTDFCDFKRLVFDELQTLKEFLEPLPTQNDLSDSSVIDTPCPNKISARAIVQNGVENSLEDDELADSYASFVTGGKRHVIHHPTIHCQYSDTRREKTSQVP